MGIIGYEGIVCLRAAAEEDEGVDLSVGLHAASGLGPQFGSGEMPRTIGMFLSESGEGGWDTLISSSSSSSLVSVGDSERVVLSGITVTW